ncbi:MAG: SLC13 family permease, partial [Planctomycetota bacterium]
MFRSNYLPIGLVLFACFAWMAGNSTATLAQESGASPEPQTSEQEKSETESTKQEKPAEESRSKPEEPNPEQADPNQGESAKAKDPASADAASQTDNSDQDNRETEEAAAPTGDSAAAGTNATSNVDDTADSEQEANSANEDDEGAATGTDEAEDETAKVGVLRPLLAMGLGVFVVLALMIRLKSHAFVALILGALTISCFIPHDVTGFAKTPEPHVIKVAPENASPVNIVKRVTSSLGGSVVGIGVLIAMAAIIGKTMLVSGAADRIVKSSLDTFGEKRAALAMMVSGFVLSIPVFFDTVFYLLVPLARSLYRSTKKNYLLYLAAIAAGGAITHTLVPPTPGPLLVADTLGVNIGMVMLVGLIVGFPSAIIGLLAAAWLNKVMPIEMRPMSGSKEQETPLEKLPSLTMSLTPVLLPVVLITIATIVDLSIGENASATMKSVNGWFALLGSPNLAMIIAALFSIYLCWRVQGHSLKDLSEHVEDALLSGGVIILITAAGGAFGALLAMTEIQEIVKSLFEGNESGGLIIIVVAYALASIIKVAQGSSTVAMIITSSLIGSIATPLINDGSLGFHPAYLVPVIGAGSLMGSWMNDSGFWVFAKMGVLTEG